jgi:type I restriction enzyme S subunit
MKNISKEKVFELRIPKLPLVQQQRIVMDLQAVQTKVDSAKALQAETATELKALVPSFLDRAFRGRL